MQYTLEAYLDIETTGLPPAYGEIMVVGIYLVDGYNSRFIQLVGSYITTDSILQALEGVNFLYTYNGSRFDLPFIYCHLGVNLAKLFRHCDLMYDCWRNNLHGGFKAVERQLGIDRRLKEINGDEVVRLWWRYVDYFDLEALDTLLEYNKEDIMDLKLLKKKIRRITT